MHRQPAVVYTIGHSNRSIETFVDLLWSSGVAPVLDVRTVPRSRHNPQFNRDGNRLSYPAQQDD